MVFSLGLAMPTVSGWCIVSLLEGTHPVLRTSERVLIGGALGLVFTMLLTFAASAFFGLPLDRAGFIFVQAITLMLSGGLVYFRRRARTGHAHLSAPAMNLSIPMLLLVLILGLWTAAKIGSGAFDLLTTPTYWSDSLTNWNMRAKVYDAADAFSLSLPMEASAVTPGISAYPPAVPLVKTWFTTLRGHWSEPLANGMHIVWYLALLALIFLSIRRHASFLVALLGAYLFAALPLPLIHGFAPYADIFMALHLFIPVILVFHASRSVDRTAALPLLRIAAFAVALLPFTKNEGLLLYAPALLLYFASTQWSLTRRGVLTSRDTRNVFLWVVAFLFALALPWVAFKWFHGLAFGNAKPITGFALGWQHGVLESMTLSLFFQGSFLLLFPLLTFLLVTHPRAAFRSEISPLVIFWLLLFVAQAALYLFTGLSVEALKQTGYARGVIHLSPLAVVIIALLIRYRRSSINSGTNDYREEDDVDCGSQ